MADAADMRLPASPHGPGGVGLILGEWPDGYSIGGVDLDSCRDPETGAMAPWACDVLALLDTYAEVSPSGTGAKAFFLMASGAVPASKGGPTIIRCVRPILQTRETGVDHPPAIELHLGGRYYAVTDDRLPEASAELRHVPTDTLRELLGNVGPAFAKGDGEQIDSRTAARGLSAWRGRCGPKVEVLPGLLGRAGRGPGTCRVETEKGEAQDGRELHRAWERPRTLTPWPRPDLGLATAETLPAPALNLTLFPGKWQPWIDRSGRARRRAQRITSRARFWPRSAPPSATHGGGARGTGGNILPNVWVACIGTASAGKAPVSTRPPSHCRNSAGN